MTESTFVPRKTWTTSLDFVFGLAVGLQGFSTISVGNCENARSPTQLCLFWLFSPPPTSPSWLRLWSVWEKREESLWLSHDPDLAHATKPVKGPLSLAWIHDTAALREVKSLLHFPWRRLCLRKARGWS